MACNHSVLLRMFKCAVLISWSMASVSLYDICCPGVNHFYYLFKQTYQLSSKHTVRLQRRKTFSGTIFPSTETVSAKAESKHTLYYSSLSRKEPVTSQADQLSIRQMTNMKVPLLALIYLFIYLFILKLGLECNLNSLRYSSAL